MFFETRVRIHKQAKLDMMVAPHTKPFRECKNNVSEGV